MHAAHPACRNPVLICGAELLLGLLPGQAVPTALRGAFQSCGQNCAGAERFLVQAPVYEAFLSAVTEAAKQLRQGPALGEQPVDCGAMCMPGLAEKVASLVDEAVADGAPGS